MQHSPSRTERNLGTRLEADKSLTFSPTRMEPLATKASSSSASSIGVYNLKGAVVAGKPQRKTEEQRAAAKAENDLFYAQLNARLKHVAGVVDTEASAAEQQGTRIKTLRCRTDADYHESKRVGHALAERKRQACRQSARRTRSACSNRLTNFASASASAAALLPCLRRHPRPPARPCLRCRLRHRLRHRLRLIPSPAGAAPSSPPTPPPSRRPPTPPRLDLRLCPPPPTHTPTHPHTHTPTHPHTHTPTHPHSYTPTHLHRPADCRITGQLPAALAALPGGLQAGGLHSSASAPALGGALGGPPSSGAARPRSNSVLNLIDSDEELPDSSKVGLGLG
jgi:hypothetical protein